MKCANCGYEIPSGTTCPNCGYTNPQVAIKSAYPMKWFKTLLVLLWFGMVGNVISSILFFTGTVYQGFADEVYNIIPSLKPVDVICGIFCLGMVVFAFIVWLRLKNYKKHAPRLLIIMYIVNTVFLIVYSIALYSIIAGAGTTIIYGHSYVVGNYQYQEYLDLSKVSFSISDIIEVVASIVMTIVNYIYFRNRRSLFVK